MVTVAGFALSSLFPAAEGAQPVITAFVTTNAGFLSQPANSLSSASNDGSQEFPRIMSRLVAKRSPSRPRRIAFSRAVKEALDFPRR